MMIASPGFLLLVQSRPEKALTGQAKWGQEGSGREGSKGTHAIHLQPGIPHRVEKPEPEVPGSSRGGGGDACQICGGRYFLAKAAAPQILRTHVPSNTFRCVGRICSKQV